MKALGDVRVQAACQVPGFTDPVVVLAPGDRHSAAWWGGPSRVHSRRVVHDMCAYMRELSPPLPLLEVADELWQLRAQVEGSGEPGGAVGASHTPGHGCQAVLDGEERLAGELVQHHTGPLPAEAPLGGRGGGG